MHIILCGMQNSGKTTIGKKLARHLELPWIDTDHEIEKLDGNKRTCRQIFSIEGAKFFREKESAIIKDLQRDKESVISTGGGTFEQKKNRDTLKALGKIIFLKPSLECLWDRMSLKGLPAYLEGKNPKEEFLQLAKKREALFLASAHLVVEEEDIEKALEHIKSRLVHGRKLFW